MTNSGRSRSISPVSSVDGRHSPASPLNGAAQSKGVQPSATEIPALTSQDSDLEKTAGDAHRIKRWPDQPVQLGQTPWGRVAFDIHDVVLCLIPIALIIKAGLCIHASKIDATHRGSNFDQTSRLTRVLVQFNMQLTTLFTIIFVLIIASTVRRFALWRAQSGAKLASLEQFHSSISLTATFKAIWALRAFSFTSVGLLFLWSWYYIGSQASEREYTFQESGPKSNIQLAYINSQATSPFSDSPVSQFPTVKRTDMTSRYHIYVSRVQTGVSKKPYDLNGYPLTPLYDRTPTSRLDPGHKLRFDSNGWLDTTEFSLQHVVSSIGKTLYSNLKDSKSANFSSSWGDGKVVGGFTYTSTHFLANCSGTQLLNQTRYPGTLPVMAMSLNMTPVDGALTADTVRSFSVWDAYNATHSLQATCNITQATVDVRTKCTAAGCKAVAVRPTQNIPYPSYRTPFDDDSFAAEFFNTLLLACGVPDSQADLTNLEADNGWNLLKTQLKLDQNSQSNTLTDLHDDAYSFPLSIALTNHINTLYDASVYMKYDHAIEQHLSAAATFTVDPADQTFTTVAMRGAELSERYQLNIGWIVVDMVSNSILLVAAVFAFWLRRKTFAPDVFGYVSSLTRDNPHLRIPTGGSTLSGMDRARRMKHVKVRFGDVMHTDGIGRVAMTHADDEAVHIRRLDRQKSYA